jgi:hypothetical protein
MQGIHEEVLVKQSFPAQQISTAGTSYNNTTIGVSSGIDMKGYDEAMVQVNCGTINGTLDVSLLASAANGAASAATAIAQADGTLADFNQITSANSNTTKVIRIRSKDTARYLFVKVVRGGATAKSFSIDVELGKPKSVPVTQDQTVDFTHSGA